MEQLPEEESVSVVSVETTFRNEKETWHKELLEEDNLELYLLILHNRKKNGNLCQLDCGDPWNDEK